MDTKKLAILLFSVLILAAAAWIIIQGIQAPKWEKACFEGKYCFWTRQGENFSQVLDSSDRAIILLEKDKSQQQGFEKVSNALTGYLIPGLNRYRKMVDVNDIYGVEYSNQTIISCSGPNISIDNCTIPSPGPNEVLIVLRPPGSRENKVVLDNRTITFEGEQGSDIGVLVYLFDRYYLS